MEIRIDEIGPSLNNWYAGSHWAQRKKVKDRWRLLVREAVAGCEAVDEEDYPVSIEVTCRFGKGRRGYDADNLGATSKLVIDGLIKAGIIEDDTRNFVESVTYRPIKHKGKDETVVRIMQN